MFCPPPHVISTRLFIMCVYMSQSQQAAGLESMLFWLSGSLSSTLLQPLLHNCAQWFVLCTVCSYAMMRGWNVSLTFKSLIVKLSWQFQFDLLQQESCLQTSCRYLDEQSSRPWKYWHAHLGHLGSFLCARSDKRFLQRQMFGWSFFVVVFFCCFF